MHVFNLFTFIAILTGAPIPQVRDEGSHQGGANAEATFSMDLATGKLFFFFFSAQNWLQDLDEGKLAADDDHL